MTIETGLEAFAAEYEDDDVDDVDDEGEEDPEGATEGTTVIDDPEGGGGAEDDPDEGDSKEPVVPLSGLAQLQALLEDPEIQSTLGDQVAEYQRTMALEAERKTEAEAFQKLIADEDWEAVGKAVVSRSQESEARKAVSSEVQQEIFKPVYAELFAQPELQTLTAEDKLALHLDNFKSPAAHVAAISGFIQQKRSSADFDARVKAGVEEALAAEKNRAAAAKAKDPVLAGRSPSPIGLTTGKVTSASLLQEGWRSILNPQAEDDTEV